MLESAEWTVPHTRPTIQIGLVESAAGPLLGLLLHKCGPFLVIAGEPAVSLFGGDDGWSLAVSSGASARNRAGS